MKLKNPYNGNRVQLTLFMSYFLLMSGTSYLSSKGRSMDIGMNVATLIWIGSPFLLAVLLLKIISCSQEVQANALQIFLAVLIVSFLMEGYLTLCTDPNIVERQVIAKRKGVAFDTRSKSDVVMDLRKNGIEVYPAVYPSLHNNIPINGKNIIPIGGISRVRTIFCNENGEYTDYESDEYGFHNPKGLYNFSKLDVGIVGDSYVQGACVKSSESIPALIRAQFPKTLATAMSVNGPLRNLASLKEYLGDQKPRVVLWFFSNSNDFSDLKSERANPVLMKYLTSKGDFKQNLKDKQEEIDEYYKVFINKQLASIYGSGGVARSVVNRLFLFNVRELVESKIANALEKPGLKSNEGEHQLFLEVLTEAKRYVSEWNGKLIVVFVPSQNQYLSNQGDRHISNEEFIKLVQSTEVPVIDLYALVKSQPNPEELFALGIINSHFNAKGYRIVTDYINRVIKEII